MSKAVIISGLLNNISDNIIPFLDKNTDVYIHTWECTSNLRWSNSIKRYTPYFNKLDILTEPFKFKNKLYSYFYSTWKVVNSIPNLSNYETIIKFKPNVDGEIKYKGKVDYYFNKAYIQSRPLLQDTNKKNCVYGTIHYQTMDERIFTTYPTALSKAFNLPFEEFNKQMVTLDEELIKTYGKFYEGSIFWKEWFERKGIKLIQDLDLKIPNSIKYE